MSKLESQVISKDDLSEKMRDEIGEMRSEMGQVIGKIDSVSKRLHAMDWRALRWRRLDWALLPHTTRKGTLSFLSLEDSVGLNNAMTNEVDRPHLLKSYKGVHSPVFDQHAYADKEDWRGLRWVMKKGVDLQGFRLKMKDEMGSGTILARLMGYVGENEEDAEDLEIAEYYATRGKLEKVDEDVGDDRCTALYLASRDDYVNIVKGLLAAGANKDKSHAIGWSPLFIAAQNGHIAVAEALLSDGGLA